jgi:hypothetical protein
MADISRWGSRFEEAMNRPESGPSTLSELITQMANEAEIDETGTQIGTWVHQRLAPLYRGCRISVNYNAPCAWYEVRLDFFFKGVMAKGVVKIRDEDVYEHTQSTTAWSKYMDDRTYDLRRDLQRSLLHGGLAHTDLAGLYAWGAPAVSMNAAADSLRAVGLQAEMAAEAMQGLFPNQMDHLEEKEAIESIKRTIANQDQP